MRADQRQDHAYLSSPSSSTQYKGLLIILKYKLGFDHKCIFLVIPFIVIHIHLLLSLQLYHRNVERTRRKPSWQIIVWDMGAFSKREGFLAQKPVTLPATIALLLIAAILPTMGICHKCKVSSLNLMKFVVDGSSIMEHISNFCQYHVGPPTPPWLS